MFFYRSDQATHPGVQLAVQRNLPVCSWRDVERGAARLLPQLLHHAHNELTLSNAPLPHLRNDQKTSHGPHAAVQLEGPPHRRRRGGRLRRGHDVTVRRGADVAEHAGEVCDYAVSGVEPVSVPYHWYAERVQDYLPHARRRRLLPWHDGARPVPDSRDGDLLERV